MHPTSPNTLAMDVQTLNEARCGFPPACQLNAQVCDVSSVTAVKALADELNASGQPLHMLVNNAGAPAPSHPLPLFKALPLPTCAALAAISCKILCPYYQSLSSLPTIIVASGLPSAP